MKQQLFIMDIRVISHFGSERHATVKREKMVYKSLSADLKPLFDWLRELSVINHVDTLSYTDDPTTFGRDIKKGYILAKLSIVAVAEKRQVYVSQINSSPQTR